MKWTLLRSARAAACVACAFGLSLAVNGLASAATRLPSGYAANQNTIAVISGNPNASYLRIAYDLSAVLDDGDNLRILPVVGKGAAQNIRDVRFLKGLDLGITQASFLSHFRQTNEFGRIDDKIVYIAKLFNEELHVVVRTDAGITSIDQLSGKKVNFSDAGSGTQLTARDVFARLGIKPIEVNMGQADAFEAIKRGEITATVLIAGKPAASTMALTAADGFRLLPVAYAKSLQDTYFPATLTHEDYPNLIGPGQTVDTIAEGAVLIAYNWPKNTDRYHRIQKFVEAFFPRISEFQKPPRHPKWRETNLAAVLPGWKRFDGAEEWLARNAATAAGAPAPTRTKFDDFLASRGVEMTGSLTQRQREQLFQEFVKWSRSKERR